MDFTHKLSTPHKRSGWIIQHGYCDILRSRDKAIQPEFISFTKTSSSPSSSQLREVCPHAAHLLFLMQNSPYLFSSKAWQAQRQNSLCLFARLSLPLRPQKPRNITMFLWLVLQHRCINRAYLPEGGFKWNSSPNSSLSTEQMTTAEHPFCTLGTRERNIHSLLWSMCLYRDLTHNISMQISNPGCWWGNTPCSSEITQLWSPRGGKRDLNTNVTCTRSHLLPHCQ